MNIHVTSDGLIKENGVFPDLHVSLRSQDLHAPLVERMIELPMDITAGACLTALPFCASAFLSTCGSTPLVVDMCLFMAAAGM